MEYHVGEILDRDLRIVNVHEGGMAVVYILDDIKTGKKAAAKTMREEFLNDSSLVARFRREMKIWLGMGEHPNVVRAFFVKDIQSIPFLFMEYMDGGSLFELIKRHHPLPVRRILQIGAGVTEGMSHVHNRITPEGLRGIIHRDLKPANILLGQNEGVKVSDFGLARAVEGTLLTKTFDVVGTMHFSSPEQVLDSRGVDKRADIYSFGAIMYHLACGIPPIEADTWPALIKKIQTVMPRVPSELRSDLPDSLSRMIMKCLAKNKKERYSSFDEIGEELSSMTQQTQTSGESPGKSGTRELHEILSASEKIAAEAGCESVEPTHLLMSTILTRVQPLSSWLRDMQIDEETLMSHIRSQSGAGECESHASEIKFRRSSRRVIGLAHTLAERDGLTSPTGKHMLKALFRESSMRDLFLKVLKPARTKEGDAGKLVDDIDGFLDASDSEEKS